jgi:hypothetical protein
MANSMTALLDLPNELLRMIAQSTNRDGLLGLSMTCRNLRPHGQEALVSTNVEVSPKNIWNLARTLRACPDLTKHFTHLRIGDLGPALHDTIKSSLSEHLETVSYASDYRDVVLHAYQTSKDIPAALRMDEVTGYLELALIVLFEISPHITAISMGTNSWDSMELLFIVLALDTIRNSGILNDCQAKLKSYLQRLEILCIAEEDFNHNMPHPEYPEIDTDWSKLSQLQWLAAPAYLLMSLDPLMDDYLYSQLFLSESTLLFQVDVDSIDRRDIVEGIDHIILSSSCLREIEIRFTHNLLSTPWAISKGGLADLGNGQGWIPGGSEQAWLDSMRRWKGNTPSVNTTFGGARYQDSNTHVCHAARKADYNAGDLPTAIKRCVAMSVEGMKQNPEMMEALDIQADG